MTWKKLLVKLLVQLVGAILMVARSNYPIGMRAYVRAAHNYVKTLSTPYRMFDFSSPKYIYL